MNRSLANMSLIISFGKKRNLVRSYYTSAITILLMTLMN